MNSSLFLGMGMGLAGLAAAVVTAAMTPVLAAWARRRDYLDLPNHRSSHVVATPRIGGVALVFGVLTGLAILQAYRWDFSVGLTPVLAGALAIALLGLIDDFRQLSALIRLAIQTAVAVAVVMTSGDAALPGFPSPFAGIATVFWLVTLTNAYNFMDGIDGIAGAQGVVAGIGWMVVGIIVGTPTVAAVGLLLATASSGFLLHNWHPAKVFMGDAGSGFMGFVFAALPLLAPKPSAAPLWLCAVLLMWPFLADTGFTLLRRASRGENILSAHRSHLYQRLVLTGRSHRDVTLVYAGLAILGAIAAVAITIGHATGVMMSLAVISAAGLGLWWRVTFRECADPRPPNQK